MADSTTVDPNLSSTIEPLKADAVLQTYVTALYEVNVGFGNGGVVARVRTPEEVADVVEILLKEGVSLVNVQRAIQLNKDVSESDE